MRDNIQKKKRTKKNYHDSQIFFLISFSNDETLQSIRIASEFFRSRDETFGFFYMQLLIRIRLHTKVYLRERENIKSFKCLKSHAPELMLNTCIFKWTLDEYVFRYQNFTLSWMYACVSLSSGQYPHNRTFP